MEVQGRHRFCLLKLSGRDLPKRADCIETSLMMLLPRCDLGMSSPEKDLDIRRVLFILYVVGLRGGANKSSVVTTTISKKCKSSLGCVPA